VRLARVAPTLRVEGEPPPTPEACREALQVALRDDQPADPRTGPPFEVVVRDDAWSVRCPDSPALRARMLEVEEDPDDLDALDALDDEGFAIRLR